MSKCEAGGNGREELKRYPPPSLAVLWIMNFVEKKNKTKQKKQIKNETRQMQPK